MRTEPGGQQSPGGITAFNPHRAVFDRHAGLFRVLANIEASTGDRHRAMPGADHERPPAVVGDAEHHLALTQFDTPLTGAELYDQLRSTVDFKL
ncbi:hypothetical protein D9M71_651200 [compost metagenome]